jgi:hypothetical protein
MDTGAVDREYPYLNRAAVLAVAVVWAAALGGLYCAATQHGPFHGRDGRVTMGEEAAAVFRWTFFGGCAVLAVLATRRAWIDRVRPRRLALTERGVLVPRVRWGWFSAEEFVPYEAITECGPLMSQPLGTRPGVVGFWFRGPRGRVRVTRDTVSDEAIAELCALVPARVTAARGGRSP